MKLSGKGGDEGRPLTSDVQELGREASQNDLAERLEKLERYNTELEARLIEQEHRLLPLWRNLFAYRESQAPEDADELDRWKQRQSATRWALLWRFVSPESATVGTVGFVALFGAVDARQGRGRGRM